MNLKQVTGKPFGTVCALCGDKAWHNPPQILYADLDGEPFKAYFHEQCAHALLRCNGVKEDAAKAIHDAGSKDRDSI